MVVLLLVAVFGGISYFWFFVRTRDEAPGKSGVSTRVVSTAGAPGGYDLSRSSVARFSHANVTLTVRYERREEKQRVVAGSKIRKSVWNNGFTNNYVEVPTYKTVKQTTGIYVLEARNEGADAAVARVILTKWQGDRRIHAQWLAYDFGAIGPGGYAKAEIADDLTGCRINTLFVERNGQVDTGQPPAP